MKCPKCAYERQAADVAPDWQCPSCKVAYIKVLQAQEAARAALTEQAEALRGRPAPDEDATDDDDRHWLLASGQKIMIYSILLNFLVRAVGSVRGIPDILLLILFACVALYAASGVVRICTGLGKSQGEKIAFMVMVFIPLVNLLGLLYLSSKATTLLRKAGWKVGLLGARP